MEKVNITSCKINRPGEFIITDRALSFCSFPANAKILDLGCGSGATVNYIIQNYGFEAFGIDNATEFENVQSNLINTSAEKIPMQSDSMDGVIMECSFSLMDDQHSVLKESNRVLRENGLLIISDMYARGEAAILTGSLGRIDKKETIITTIENCGFEVELFEDYTQLLKTMWGQMIFEKGAENFYSELGVCADVIKQIKCGYYLIVAKKGEQSA
jgi:ubiquinone/menaquinone biosynthesis C-methylase UbiE